MRLSGSFAGGLRACFPLPAPQDSVLLRPFAPDTVRTQAYFPGELITAWIGKPLGGPFIWQYTAAVRNKSSGKFSDRGPALPVHQNLSGHSIGAAVVVDLDRDGDLDLVSEDFIWSNDGTGHFTRQTAFPYGVLGDIDGDGDLDVVGGSGVWLNDGGFIFRKAASAFGPVYALVDADGDGDLDVFTEEYSGATNYTHQLVLWRNDGSGNFAKAGLRTQFTPATLKAADLDNDGDIDLLGWYGEVFLNDGTGTFTQMDSGIESNVVTRLGDLDGDGDLDVLAGAWAAYKVALAPNDYPDQVWLNDGNAHFTRGQAPLPGFSPDIQLGDLDGDGDLDAIVSRHLTGVDPDSQPSQILINDGAGHFSPSGTMGGQGVQYLSLGDLDGDGDLDVVLSEWDGTASDATLHVWLQDG